MIELKRDKLIFSFPEVHKQAKLTVTMQRTLRIPDDGKRYPLPPGLGKFPLRHVDDFSNSVPSGWRKRGGVMMPIYQSEALWLHFESNFDSARRTGYPFAIKIATGKINAVNGEGWSNGLSQSEQDYLVSPLQPWLDGYCVEKGLIRQFVAMPLGAGYTAEEQITGEAEHGGLQIIVYPMKAKEFEKRFPYTKLSVRRRARSLGSDCQDDYGCITLGEMGLSPGGMMNQEITDDPYGHTVWDSNTSSRCFVHLANSMTWSSITGKTPPHPPMTAKKYSKYGLPWFEYYTEQPAIEGSERLNNLKSVREMGELKGDQPLPENETATPSNIQVTFNKTTKFQVREGEF